MIIGTIEAMHKEFLMKALIKTNGKIGESARLLGISERTVYHKMTKHNIKKEDYIKNKKGAI